MRKFGLPSHIVTNKRNLFHQNVPTAKALPPFRLALQRLEIEWSAYGDLQGSALVQRFFEFARKRLRDGLRAAEVQTLDQANAFLGVSFLPLWKQAFYQAARDPHDAHRVLAKPYDLASFLSIEEKRILRCPGIFHWDGRWYRLTNVGPLRWGSIVTIEHGYDSPVMFKIRGSPVEAAPCHPPQRRSIGRRRRPKVEFPRSQWMKDFRLSWPRGDR